MINLKLKDGSIREVESGLSAAELVKGIGSGLFKAACAVKIDGVLSDLRSIINKDCEFEVLTFDNDEGKKTFRHTASHILAQAAKHLFPNAKLAIGPAIDNGFYYDFEVDTPFSNEQLASLELEMKKIISANYPLECFTLPRNEAISLMTEKVEPYKVQLIQDLPVDSKLSFYKQNDFVDLCAGPHLLTTGGVKAVKLLSCTGAYWRGDSKNKMLQRIYGTAFTKETDLNAHLTALEEAAKRDHRKLGRELDLFDIMDEGKGFPFFFPKGMILRNLLENFWREEHIKNNYQEVKTPIILNQDLWHRSGHWDHYKDNMYVTQIDDTPHAIKPMNCPGGMLVFKRKLHSYRDLPQRMAELGLVHRHELSGALHGLMRVRCFTQDDAHIFMTPDQVESEIIGVITLIDSFYKVFGFSYKLELSTRPDNSMGSDEQWEKATLALKTALDKNGKEYKINHGDGAFYGPKIDFHLEDSIGRTWQCGTIQLDFQMPELFDLEYVGPNNEKQIPVMIHRVVFGSIERFIAILTEHFAGAFPLWLAPVQVKVIPISDKHLQYANQIMQKLQDVAIRCEIDDRSEKIGYKIRAAQLEKIPYMLIIGDKELENNSVSVRSRKDGDIGTVITQDLIQKLISEINTKSNGGGGGEPPLANLLRQ